MNKILFFIAVMLMQPVIVSVGQAETLGKKSTIERSFWLDQIIGNTLVISRNDQSNEASATYFINDGTGWAATKEDAGVIHVKPMDWLLQSDGQICIRPEKNNYKNAACFILALEGKNVLTIPEGKSATNAQILQGDAWKLEEQALGHTIRVLNGKVAVDAMIGNTFILTGSPSKHEHGAYYFQKNGVGQLLSHNSEPDDAGYIEIATTNKIEWTSMQNGKLCITGRVKLKEKSYCGKVSIVADRVKWEIDGKYNLYGRLMLGDDKNLSTLAIAASARMRDKLIGSTLLLRKPNLRDQESAIYIDQQHKGRIAKKTNGIIGSPVSIQWMLRADRNLFCLTEIIRGYKFTQDECFEIFIENKDLTLKSERGPLIIGNIVTGNAWDL